MSDPLSVVLMFRPVRRLFFIALCLSVMPACSGPDDTSTGDDDSAVPDEAVCGDGYLSRGEECEDGNTDPGDGCDENCELEATCGNGFLDAGELCDDGNTEPGDGCDENCRVEEPECGNGEVEEGEECDDGNNDPGDGCDEGCMEEADAGCGPNVRWFEFYDSGGAEQRFNGDTGGENDNVEPPVSCSGRESYSDVVLVIRTDRYVRGTFTTDDPGTRIDTALLARSVCLDAATDLACNDNDPQASVAGASTLVLDMAPGDTRFLWVDSMGLGGEFVLDVRWTELVAPGDPCDPTGPACAPGHRCDGATGTCVPGNPPHLDFAEVYVYDRFDNNIPDELRFVVSGGDDDRDLTELRISLQDASGGRVGVRSEVLPATINDDVLFTDLKLLWPQLYQVDYQGRGEFVELTLIDELGLTSAPLLIPVQPLVERQDGEQCDPDGWTDFCASGLTCAAGLVPPICEANAIPTQTTFRAFRHNGDLRLFVEGGDANGDLSSWSIHARRSTGFILSIDRNQDGIPESSFIEVEGYARPPILGNVVLRTGARVPGFLNEVDVATDMASTWSQLGDLSGARSATLANQAEPWPLRALGEACDPDGFLDLCTVGTCVDDGSGPVCTADPVLDQACVSAPQGGPGLWSGSTATGSTVGPISCAAAPGPTSLLVLDPVVPSRVRVSPDALATDFSTVLLAREYCGAPASEIACSVAAPLELDAWTGEPIVLGVSDRAGGSGDFGLNVELVPLSFAGEACDPAGVVSVCAEALVCLDPGGGYVCR